MLRLDSTIDIATLRGTPVRIDASSQDHDGGWHIAYDVVIDAPGGMIVAATFYSPDLADGFADTLRKMLNN